MPKAYAQWRVAGHRFRVALVACILWHGDGATRHPHCPGEVVAGVDATAAPLRNLHRQEQTARIAGLPGCLAAGETTSNRAEIFSVLSLFHDPRCRPKGAVSVPADGTRRRRAPDSVGRAAAHIGLADWFNAMRVPLTDMLTWIRKPWPDVMLRLLETFSGAPLVSSIADRYFARYGSVYSMRPSEQVRGLFARWSIKFSADYYEAKDREEDRNGPRLG